MSFKRFGTKASFLKCFKLQPYPDSVPIPTWPLSSNPKSPLALPFELQESCATRFLKFLERYPPCFFPCLISHLIYFVLRFRMNHLVGVDDGHQVDFRWFKTRGLGSFKTYRVARNFCGLAIFCVLWELIFAIRTDWFFLLAINFWDFQKVSSTQH